MIPCHLFFSHNGFCHFVSHNGFTEPWKWSNFCLAHIRHACTDFFSLFLLYCTVKLYWLCWKAQTHSFVLLWLHCFGSSRRLIYPRKSYQLFPSLSSVACLQINRQIIRSFTKREYNSVWENYCGRSADIWLWSVQKIWISERQLSLKACLFLCEDLLN